MIILDIANRDTYTEQTTRAEGRVQTWRQVGWIGHTGRVYTLDDDPKVSEPGGYMPLWIQAHNEEQIAPGDAQ